MGILLKTSRNALCPLILLSSLLTANYFLIVVMEKKLNSCNNDRQEYLLKVSWQQEEVEWIENNTLIEIVPCKQIFGVLKDREFK